MARLITIFVKKTEDKAHQQHTIKVDGPNPLDGLTNFLVGNDIEWENVGSVGIGSNLLREDAPDNSKRKAHKEKIDKVINKATLGKETEQ